MDGLATEEVNKMQARHMLKNDSHIPFDMMTNFQNKNEEKRRLAGGSKQNEKRHKRSASFPSNLNEIKTAQHREHNILN